MMSHDSPETGSAKWRIFWTILVSFAQSKLSISALHDGSSSPSPCSQWSIRVCKRLSSDWYCPSISSRQSLFLLAKSFPPRLLQCTPCTAVRILSTVRGGARVERRREAVYDKCQCTYTQQLWSSKTVIMSNMSWPQGCTKLPSGLKLIFNLEPLTMFNHEPAKQVETMQWNTYTVCQNCTY